MYLLAFGDDYQYLKKVIKQTFIHFGSFTVLGGQILNRLNGIFIPSNFNAIIRFWIQEQTDPNLALVNSRRKNSFSLQKLETDGDVKVGSGHLKSRLVG